MKEGYIPRDERKKIMLISDDIRLPSGVGNVSRDIVIQTSHHFNWVNIGGAMQHPEAGKRFDVSNDTNTEAGIEDSSVFIYPVNGYGDASLLRQLIALEKPDALFLVTDPRYFTWLFDIENEIRKQIPIIYLNIWDDYPAPMYNRSFYESCDALLGISKQTVNINKLVLGGKAEWKVIDYVPHGINEKYIFPIDKSHNKFAEVESLKNRILGGKTSKFTLFFNSRNIRRKQIPDTILAWKYFIDQLPKEEADQCFFILHTQAVDENGTDLYAVKNYLFGRDYQNIIFSEERIPVNELNLLYNCSDAQILLSSNEGWGLSLTEALIIGNPIIGNVTGGMQDQMGFEDENGNWFTPDANIPSNHTGRFKKHGKWAFPVYPTSRSLQGSVPTPYIWDDRCEPQDAAEQIMKLYLMSPEERKELGKAGREWALGKEAGFTATVMGERVIKNIDKLFNVWKPREKYELINANEIKENTLNHKLLY